jgi:hypothetical protein
MVTLSDFAPNGARSLGVLRSYKHLAPLERKPIHRLHFQVESTISHLPLGERCNTNVVTQAPKQEFWISNEK